VFDPAAHVIVGTSLSSTVTVKLQVVVSPHSSSAVYSIVETPTEKRNHLQDQMFE
jgi:hypothetical protein